MEVLEVRTSSRTDLKEITGEVSAAVSRVEMENGVCVISIPHTTAGVTINENADPSVRHDIDSTLDRLVPWEGPYRHAEGNAAAHVKSSLMGHSSMVPVREGRLVLGTWQGIYLCEFDGPRTRKVYVQVLTEA